MDACLKIDEIEAYVAGELSIEDKTRIETHIVSCSDCREAVEASRQAGRLGHGIRQAYERVVVSDSSSTLFNPAERASVAESIEGYEILHEIHRGGQGVVYKAVQQATKRTVALKVLLHGPYASAKQQHRFEREIDLVASLQHPNIVTIYDSGLAQGRHYFAMEYIHGKPLDDYVSSAKWNIDETLRLFQKICAAVNFAHQHGVIHRDLKPGNICVDTAGEPHVLDFGLAKAAGPDLQDGVPVTAPGEFMGTLAYASPEQTKGDPRLIDIRTDVYSLGVILFEMLTGVYPYQVVGHLAEVLRNIAEAEPKRPSTIRRKINDEVETIVLKALSKGKERRYQSAEALARDVGRYLAGEPLDAKRDSAWYVFRKSLRRYRYVAGVAAAFVLVLGVSTIALSVMYRNQSRARQEAETARAEAQQRAEELETVTEFQQSMLSEIDAEAMGRALYADLRDRVRDALEAEGMSPEGIESTAASLDQMLRHANATDVALKLIDDQVLSNAVEAIEADFAEQPLVRAALQQTVASTYRDIGRYPPAVPLQEAALQTRRSKLGNDHPLALDSVNEMAYLLESMGKFEEAHALYMEALEGYRRTLGNDDPLTLTAVNNLSFVLASMGKLEEAFELNEEALAGRRRVLGNDHPETFTSLNNMGALLSRMGRNEEALECYRESLEGNRRVLGDDHPDTLSSLNNMGNLLQNMDRLEEALACHRKALEGRRRVRGNDHPETLASITNMGVLFILTGDGEKALEHFREALAGWERTLGEDHPDTLLAVSYIGVLLKKMGRIEEAEPYYRRALETNRRVLGADHPRTIIAVHNMGGLLRELGKLEEAEAHGAQAVAWARASRPEGHPDVAAYLFSYGRTLSTLERFADADDALLESYEVLEAAIGGRHRRVLKIIRGIIEHYEAWHAAEPEAGHDAQANAWRAKLAAATEPQEAESQLSKP